MPKIFVQGLPISSLTPDAQRLANELDNERTVNRADGAQRGDGVLSASELQAGLATLDQFSPDEQQTLLAMAKAIGLDASTGPKMTWVDRTPPPWMSNDQYYGDDMVSLGGDIYMTGREPGSLSRYEPQTDRWTKIELPPGLGSGSITAFGDKLAVVSPSGAALYDPQTQSWQALPNPGLNTTAPAVAGVNGKLYAFGGQLNGLSDQVGDRFVKTAKVLDPATNQWSKLPDLPVPRVGAQAIGVGDKIYVIGGWDNPNGWVGDNQNWGDLTNRVDVFDTTAGKWQDPPFQIPNGIASPSVWLENGKIHIAGGQTRSLVATGHGSTTEEVLDPATGQVQEAAPLPLENAGFALVARTGDRKFIFGFDSTNKWKPFAKELTAADPSSSAGGGTTVVVNNNVVNNNTTINVLNVLQSITNTVTVNQIENVTNNVDVHVVDNQIDQTFNLSPLSFLQLGNGQAGFFDPDHDFYLRTQAQGRPLFEVGSGPDGKRVLVGQAAGKLSPLPHGRTQGLYLYNPASQTVVPFSTDANGQCAIPLPDGVHGQCLIFGRNGQEISGAGAIDVP